MGVDKGKPLEGFEGDALALLWAARQIVEDWRTMPVHPKGSHRVAAAVDRLAEVCDQVDPWFDVYRDPPRPD